MLILPCRVLIALAAMAAGQPVIGSGRAYVFACGHLLY